MSILRPRIPPAILLACCTLLAAQSNLAPEVLERRLNNGLRILAVERPGGGMVRAGLVVRGGSAEVPGLPPIAARLLAQSLFSRLCAEDLGEKRELDLLLDWADHLREGLRVDRLRKARGAAAGGEEEALAASLADLGAKTAPFCTPQTGLDLLDRLGAVHRELRTEADGILEAMDLPAAALGPWLDLEAKRLHALRLARFHLQQESLGHRLGEDAAERESPSSLLLNAALPGHPYGEALATGGLAPLQRGEVRAWARQALTPDRMALILVGELRLETLLPALERTLGSLESGEAGRRDPAAEDTLQAPGTRRLEAVRPGRPRLIMGWRVPPATHPDHLALTALALAFTGEEGGAAPTASHLLGVRTNPLLPGGRFVHLFAVEAEPEEGHGIHEAEEEVQRLAHRAREESPSPEAFEGILRRLELASLRTQADAGQLLRSLAQAWCQAGDWRSAFPSFRELRREGPAALQRVARRYLTDANLTSVLLHPDLAQSSDERGESVLLRLLRARALKSVGDPVRAEALANQAMEQLLLLSREQRERIRKILEGAP